MSTKGEPFVCIHGRVYRLHTGVYQACATVFFIFEVKLAFEMLTVLGKQHSFLTHERVFLGQCQSFWDRKCLDLRGTRPPIFGYMPNALTCWAIWARHLLSLVVEYWLWRYRYFWSKVNIWNVNCARATASFSTHERVVLGKCQSFWDRKCLDLRGTRTSSFSIFIEILCTGSRRSSRWGLCSRWLHRGLSLWQSSVRSVRHVDLFEPATTALLCGLF